MERWVSGGWQLLRKNCVQSEQCSAGHLATGRRQRQAAAAGGGTFCLRLSAALVACCCPCDNRPDAPMLAGAATAPGGGALHRGGVQRGVGYSSMHGVSMSGTKSPEYYARYIKRARGLKAAVVPCYAVLWRFLLLGAACSIVRAGVACSSG